VLKVIQGYGILNGFIQTGNWMLSFHAKKVRKNHAENAKGILFDLRVLTEAVLA
jgi:hypothetical protein